MLQSYIHRIHLNTLDYLLLRIFSVSGFKNQTSPKGKVYRKASLTSLNMSVFSHSSLLLCLLFLLITCFNFNLVLTISNSSNNHSSNSTSSKVPTKIGKGYRLISVEETPDGGFLAYLQVNKKNKIYGSDISLLRLFVKWVFLFIALLLLFPSFSNWNCYPTAGSYLFVVNVTFLSFSIYFKLVFYFIL